MLPEAVADGHQALVVPVLADRRERLAVLGRDQELAAFGQAMSAQPQYAPALLGLAEIYYEQGKLSLAYPLFQQALEYQPDYPAREQIEAIFFGQ